MPLSILGPTIIINYSLILGLLLYIGPSIWWSPPVECRQVYIDSMLRRRELDEVDQLSAELWISAQNGAQNGTIRFR